MVKVGQSGQMGIGNRLRLMMLTLILAIFVVVLITFNVLVQRYIEQNVHSQLEQATVLMRAEPPKRIPPEATVPTGYPDEQFPDFKSLPDNRLAEGVVFIIDRNYRVLVPDGRTPYRTDFSALIGLTADMQEKRIALDSNDVRHVQSGGREYYLVVSPWTASDQSSTYLVYSIDMTAITNFASLVNTMLLIVMALTSLLALVPAMVIANNISRPVMELSDFATRIGSGDFSPLVGSYQDQELVRLADSMNKAAAQLEAYDADQKLFFQNVSHELRTPLQTISCNAEGIGHGILEPGEASRTIMSETEELAAMVEDLLYLSRMDSTARPLVLEPNDMRELLSNCAQRQRSLANERSIALTFDFDEEAVLVTSDAESLSRAFSNLLSNAIRFACSSIVLSCRSLGDHVAIAIVDDGPGIADQDLPRIFDRFFKGPGGKHGIGLSIVKSVIRAHRGTVEVQRLDNGTTAFIVTLPC